MSAEHHYDAFTGELLSRISVLGLSLEAGNNSQTPDQIRSYLREGGTNHVVSRFENLMTVCTRLDQRTRDKTAQQAEEGLYSIVNGERLTTAGRVGLEALICLSGRPAVATKNGSVSHVHPLLVEWKDSIAAFELTGKLAQRIRSVGRIDKVGEHQGTGFVVGKDLVLTNLHVLEAIATPIKHDGKYIEWRLDQDVSISFADAPDCAGQTNRFKIIGVAGAGGEPTGGIANPRLLDAALLVVDTDSCDDPFPKAAELSSADNATSLQQAILLIGYPAALSSLPKFNDKIDEEGMEVIQQLFNECSYGSRHVSPGIITISANGTPESLNKWSFCHDATSLGGSSGSCIIELTGNARTIGLHCSGAWRLRNYAHAMSFLKPSASFLNTPSVQWV